MERHPRPLNLHMDATRGAKSIGWPALDWVIIGGESGRNARPFDIAWARDLIAQCKAAGVPAFVKQLGAYVVGDPMEFHGIDGEWENDDMGGPLLKHPKGGDPAEWPEDLRVREWPEATQ